MKSSKTSDLHAGFFCYNCIYWVDTMGGKSTIVDNKGPDVFGNVSEVIAFTVVATVMNPITTNWTTKVNHSYKYNKT